MVYRCVDAKTHFVMVNVLVCVCHSNCVMAFGAKLPGYYRAMAPLLGSGFVRLQDSGLWSGGNVHMMLPFLHILYVRHISALLCLGTVDNTSAL